MSQLWGCREWRESDYASEMTTLSSIDVLFHSTSLAQTHSEVVTLLKKIRHDPNSEHVTS